MRFGAPDSDDSAALPLAALANETFILYKRPGGPGLYDTIITACRGAGFSPRVGQEAPRIISTLNLVAAGLGVSIVPAVAATAADGWRSLSTTGRTTRSCVRRSFLRVVAAKTRPPCSASSTSYKAVPSTSKCPTLDHARDASHSLLLVNKPFHVLTQFTSNDGKATLSDFVSAPGSVSGGPARLRQRRTGAADELGSAASTLGGAALESTEDLSACRWKTIPTAAALERLQTGVELNDGVTRPAQAAARSMNRRGSGRALRRFVFARTFRRNGWR